MSCAIEAGCAPRALVRDWSLVKRLTANEFGPGRESTVRFTEVPQTRLGKRTHLRALRVVARVQVKAAGVPANKARTHHALRALLYNFSLSDSEGHKYVDALDGRSLADHAFFDRGMLCLPAHLARQQLTGAALAGIAANSAVDVNVTVTWEIDLAGRVGDMIERLIPVCRLAARDAEAFKFTCREGGLPKHSTETFGAISFFQPTATGDVPGVEVWGDFVDLDVMNEPPRWGVRNYELRESDAALHYPEATTLYAVARPFPEDGFDGQDNAAGELLVQTMDGITVAVGGRDAIANKRRQEVVYRDLSTLDAEPRSYIAEAQPGLALPVESAAAGTMGCLMLLPPRPRESAPAGRVNYRIEQFPAGKLRVLHSWVKCSDATRMKAFNAASGGGVAVQAAPGTGALVGVSPGALVDPTGSVQHVKA